MSWPSFFYPLPSLEDVWWDVRYALRQLRRQPIIALTTIATLALGIGLNTAVFALANGILFSGFPQIDAANRIVYLVGDPQGPAGSLSYPEWEDWRSQSTSFEGALGVVLSGGSRTRLIDEDGSAETYDATQLSAHSFRILRQRPILGRDFTDEDERPGAAPVLILSYHVWERQFGKAPGIIGRTVRVNSTVASWGAIDSQSGVPATVVGVMPAGFEFPFHRVDLWLPLAPTAGLTFPDLRDRHSRRFWFAFGRLAPGVSREQAQAEMALIGRRVEEAHPDTNRGVVPRVMTFREFWIGPHAGALYGALWAAVACVLLIACANLAGVTMANFERRSREMGVRVALGAGRWRIVRQVLVESVVLSAGGGVLAWFVANVGLRIYNVWASPPISYTQWNFALDHRGVVYLVALSLISGLTFGAAPALRLFQLDVNSALKQSGGSAGNRRGRRTLAWVVVGEIALALVMIVGAGTLVRSVVKIATADLGINTENVLTVPIGLAPGTYPTIAAQMAIVRTLQSRLQGIPGVESVAMASALPAGAVFSPGKAVFEVENRRAAPDGSPGPAVATVMIGSDYFQTLGATVQRGRGFTSLDGSESLPVAIVNERFGRVWWPGDDPIGKRLRLYNGRVASAWVTVVGVASNIVQSDRTGQDPDPVIYRPLTQNAVSIIWALARTRIAPPLLASAVRREIDSLDPDLLVGPRDAQVASLQSRLRSNYWIRSVNGALFSMFGGLALGLASLGLYAVVASATMKRTHEIGIRTALGATAGDVRALVFKEGLLPVALGLAIGLVGALTLTPVLRSQLVAVSPADPLTLAAAVLVLLACGALACWLPARRACRVDPLIALRGD